MWIIQGTLAWLTPPVRIGVRSNGDRTFYSLVGSWRSGGGPQLLYSREIVVHTLLISVWTTISRAQIETKNYEITPFILG
ncbi:hypothetical protein KSP40_PGU005764 [Platanthera guangdongensis]|uniref:Uncharacterized protein ycf68 n=1 Tax=Platanthera guangdongensis TaxID=2320717 RepID=A0ABR2LF94_9ASPA